MKKDSSNSFDLVTFVSSLWHRNESYCHYHSHPVMEIVYHPNGRGWTSIRDKRVYDFTTDTAIIYWPNIAHDQTVEKTGDDICIQLAISNVKCLPEDKQFVKADLRDQSSLKREILNLERTPASRTQLKQNSADLRATALLIDLVALALEQEKHENSKPETSGTVFQGIRFYY